MNDLMKYRIDIQAAIGTGYLREVFELNDSRPGQTFTDGDYVNAFVLATRYGNTPRLFECHPDGILEESGIVCLGSQGARFAKDYLERRLTSGASSKIRLADSICLAIHALDVAKRDVFTSGYDFAVVMPDQIRECGWRLNQELYLALSGYVNSVAHELDPDLYINNFPGKPPKE
jgi:20S proteasome alpha/beta subunit